MGHMEEEQVVFEPLEFRSIKGALLSLRKFMETENPSKMWKNVFHLK